MMDNEQLHKYIINLMSKFDVHWEDLSDSQRNVVKGSAEIFDESIHNVIYKVLDSRHGVMLCSEDTAST